MINRWQTARSIVLSLILSCLLGCSSFGTIARNHSSEEIRTVNSRWTLYNQHGVFAKEEGLEQNVIVEDGKVRNWYSRLTYLDDSYKIGGKKHGTRLVPYASHDIYYMDCPVDDFVKAVDSGTPIPWGNKGVCVRGHGRSCVRKGPDGSYHLLAWPARYIIKENSSIGNEIDYYVSDSGNPGTWRNVRNGVIRQEAKNKDLGNNSFFWEGDTVYVFLELWLKRGWGANLLSGPDLLNLREFAGNPIIPEGNNAGEIQPQRQNGKYIIVGHASSMPGKAKPTNLIKLSAEALAGPWKEEEWVLILDGNFMNDQKLPFTENSQLADPSVVEIKGRTYIFYEVVREEQFEVPSLAVAYRVGGV